MLGTSFCSRVFVTSPVAGGNFGLAFDADSPSPSVVWPVDLSFDTTYHVVISYDYDTGDVELWLDPINQASQSILDTSGTASTTVVAFAFRQSDDYNGSIVIDNLRVGPTFATPTTVSIADLSSEGNNQSSMVYLLGGSVVLLSVALDILRCRKTI